MGPIDTRSIVLGIDGQGALFDGITIDATHITVSGLSVYGMRKGIFSDDISINNLHIWGNYIGVSEDGSRLAAPYGNTSFGIDLRNVSDSHIGTDFDGEQDNTEGNLISSNFHGVNLSQTDDIVISGNYIGVDKSASGAIPNEFIGILVANASGTNVIGVDDRVTSFDLTHARNIISGNNIDGIRITNSDNQVIAGNYIGAGRSGLTAITNGNYGIQIEGNSSNNQIGVDSDGNHDSTERNLISGNGSGYRSLTGGSGSGNYLAGNFIGTDASGFFALPNLNNGINVISFSSTRVGTNGDGVQDNLEGNVISGNDADGIRLDQASDGLVSGNYIGVTFDGISSLPNQGRGVFIAGTSTDNVIGFDPAMVQTDLSLIMNIIKYNDDAGIAISGSNAVRNRISRNSIAFNTGLGIDLGYDGVTPNDNADTDNGANRLFNFPVISSVSLAADSTLIIKGFASVGATIEVFISDGEDNPNPLPGVYTTSFGEGQTYLFTAVEGSADDLDGGVGSYTNDGTGATTTKNQNRFEFQFDLSGIVVESDAFLTATATDSNGNTSEFSGVIDIGSVSCGTAILNPHVMFYRSSY